MKADVGIDKTLLPFSGFDSLIEYQHDKLSQIFYNIYLSSKQSTIPNLTNYIFDLNHLDEFNTSRLYAPTLSIYSSLSYLQSKTFFVPVDMPLVSIETFRLLYEAVKLESDAVILKSGEKVYPTCGIYSPNVLKSLKQMILEDRHKLQLFLAEIDTIYIELPQSDEFSNINNYSDYERILNK